MNQWYFDIGILGVLLLLTVGFLSCIIMIMIRKVRKRKGKAVGISIGINAIFSGGNYFVFNLSLHILQVQ